MDSMPPCCNSLEIAKTKRRLAAILVHNIMMNKPSGETEDKDEKLSQWYDSIDAALDEYDNAVQMIKDLKANCTVCGSTISEPEFGRTRIV